MASSKNSLTAFQQVRARDSTRLGSILPMFIVAVCAAIQTLFTDYFSGVPVSGAVVVYGLVGVVFVGRYLIKEPSQLVKVADTILLHAALAYALIILVPIPSPYLLFVMLLATTTYLRFGFKPMVFSFIGMFSVITSGFIYRYGLDDVDRIVLYLTTYAIIVALTYYSILYLRISETEIKSTLKLSNRAVSQQKQLESLINNISDGVIAVDANLKVKVYNAAALNVLDVNTDISKKDLDSILKPVDAESKPVDIKDILKQTTIPTINRDLRIVYTDGSAVNLFIGIAPVYLGFGKSENNGYTIIIRDITREKSLEEERDEFISVVSHELRTPIAISEGNISNAEFIAEKSGDMTAVKAALKEAHNQVLFLAAMINDLSTLSRAERGVLEVAVEPIDIQELGQELLKNYTPDAEKKSLKLSLELDPKLEQLHSTKLYVREVLQNFITNAIKYTETGSVTIGAKPDAKGVTFYVRDTGIGISKGDQDRVFDKFFRSEDYRTRQNNGTGLGLYVTMKLTKILHAEISLDSELNKGSTFTIFFPNFEDKS